MEKAARVAALSHAALRALEAHVAILDEDGTIVFVNDAWRRFGERNGLREGEADVGSSYLAACRDDLAEGVGDARRAKLALLDVLAGRRESFELEYPCHSAQARRWFIARASRFTVAGSPYLVVTHEDITPRRMEEDELRTSHAALEAFSASVSHDLRAPLRRIAMLAEELEADPGIEGEARALAAQVAREATRARALVRDLLALSQASEAPLMRREIDLSGMLGEIFASLRVSEPERKVETRFGRDLRVRADPGLLRIALENILSNAWKFTRRTEHACIEVEVETDTREGCVVRVKDNGVGFDAAGAASLFRPFSRLASARGFEGTGVGLATVARIIERHGGRVWAEGRPGEGAIISFSLPP